MSDQSSLYGRVDEANNVFVFENGTERKVGQYPGVSGADALAYFERKYSDLDAQVRIFEQRVANKVDTHGLRKALQKIVAELVEPAAVGDARHAAETGLPRALRRQRRRGPRLRRERRGPRLPGRAVRQ